MDYTGGYSTFSLARFGQQFVDQVANPKNLLLWYRKKAGTGLGRLKHKSLCTIYIILYLQYYNIFTAMFVECSEG